jgi:two-component system LytT family response regulator
MDALIVDDEAAARRTLRECCEREGDIRVIGEYADAPSALEALQTTPVDLLLLDIQIDTMNGVQLARSLTPPVPLIVFVTAYDQYALQAFDLNAADYLLKPFDDERFARTLARVRQRLAAESLAQRHDALTRLVERLEAGASVGSAGGPGSAGSTPKRLLAEGGGRMHMLDPVDVELLEADRNYVRLTVGRDVFHARSTLAQAERALRDQPLLRISRSCLVNINHVREVSRTARGDVVFVLRGGTTVSSSEGFRDSVRVYLQRLRLNP